LILYLKTGRKYWVLWTDGVLSFQNLSILYAELDKTLAYGVGFGGGGNGLGENGLGLPGLCALATANIVRYYFQKKVSTAYFCRFTAFWQMPFSPRIRPRVCGFHSLLCPPPAVPIHFSTPRVPSRNSVSVSKQGCVWTSHNSNSMDRSEHVTKAAL